MPGIGEAIVGIFTAIKATKLGAFALKFLASTALNMLAAKLMGKPSQPGIRVSGLGSGEDFPRAMVLGKGPAAASLVWHGSHGQIGKTPNNFYTMVVALADAPGTQLNRIAFAGEWVELGDAPHPVYGRPIAKYNHKNKDHGWVRYYDGTQTVADPGMVSTYGSDEYPWTERCIGHGMAYAIITLQLTERELFPNGRPEFVAELLGPPVYDRRRDSTAGGDGPQREDDPGTWERSENLAVLADAVARGIPLPGGRVYGGGVSFEPAGVAASANVCDVIVGEDEDARPQFHGGLQIAFAESEPATTIETLLSGALGQVATAGTGLVMHVGEPPVPTVHITDDDIVITAPQVSDQIRTLQETNNAITVTHLSPDHIYQPLPTGERRHLDWEALDGQYLPAELQIPPIYSHGQAQQVGEAMLADGRRWRQHTMLLPPDIARRLRPLQTLTWSSAREGYAAKAFQVVGVELDLRSMFAVVNLREWDPDDHDWSPDFELPAPPTPLPSIIQPRVMDPDVWSAAATAVQDADGDPRRPAVEVVWDPEAVEDAALVDIEVRLAGGDVVAQVTVARQEGHAVLSEGILASTGYSVRIRPRIWLAVEWSEPKGVTTADLKLGKKDIIPELIEPIEELIGWIEEDIPSYLDEIRGWIDDGFDLPTITVQQLEDLAAAMEAVRAVRELIHTLAAEVLDQAMQGEMHREEMGRELRHQTGVLQARYTELVTIVTGADIALVQRVAELEANSGTLQALVTQLELAFASEAEALAALITSLSVGSATAFDHLHMWRFDSTAQGWVGSPNDPAITTPGWLRPGAGASSIVSPGGLAWSLASYRQVRMLLRRVGEPEWVGHLWWAGEEEGWDEARRMTLPEPGWGEGGEAPVTVNLAGAAMLDRFRADLAEGADGENYIEVDWIGVGSPSPGASSAEVAEERLARISGMDALAALITTLTARTENVETGQQSLVEITSGLSAEVTQLGGLTTAIGQRIDGVEAEIEDPETGLDALGAAYDQLKALVEETESGGVVVVAEQNRQVQSSLTGIAAEVLEGLFGAAAADGETRDIIARASQTLGTRIDLTDQGLQVVSRAVTELEAAIPGLASATALEALQVSLTALDGRVTAEAGRLLVLETNLTGVTSNLAQNYYVKSEVDGSINTAVSGLQTTLESQIEGVDSDINATLSTLYYTRTQTDGQIQSATSQIQTNLQNQINGLNGTVGSLSSNLSNNYFTKAETDGQISKAVAGVLLELGSEIGDLEGDLDKISANLTNNYYTNVETDDAISEAVSEARLKLEAAIGDLDDDLSDAAFALDLLQVKVDNHDGQITAQAQALTQLSAATDPGNVNSINVRYQVITGPGGFSRIGLQARQGGGGTWRAAALFLDVPNNTSLPTRFAAVADRFTISTGAGAGAPNFTPFAVTGSSIRVAVPLQSTNYAVSGGVPTAGFRLDPETGTVSAVNIIQRNAIVPGATFDRWDARQDPPFAIGPDLNTWYVWPGGVISIDQTTTAQAIVVSASMQVRRLETNAQGGFVDGRVRLQRRIQLPGQNFDTWVDISDEIIGAHVGVLLGRWSLVSARDVLAGGFAAAEYRWQIHCHSNGPSPHGNSWDHQVFRMGGIVAERKIV